MLPESGVKIVNIEMQLRNELLQNCMTRYFCKKTPPILTRFLKLVVWGGIEPPTQGFSVLFRHGGYRT
jgi:hypothetical protein